MPSKNLFNLAAEHHHALPGRIREYLHARGIPDDIINRRFLGWNGKGITIPVFNRKGVCASFRLAKDPEDTSDSPKMLWLPGSLVELYGWEVLRLNPKRVVICEGEFDRLVLETNGFEESPRLAVPARSGPNGRKSSPPYRKSTSALIATRRAARVRCAWRV